MVGHSLEAPGALSPVLCRNRVWLATARRSRASRVSLKLLTTLRVPPQPSGRRTGLEEPQHRLGDTPGLPTLL